MLGYLLIRMVVLSDCFTMEHILMSQWVLKILFDRLDCSVPMHRLTLVIYFIFCLILTKTFSVILSLLIKRKLQKWLKGRSSRMPTYPLLYLGYRCNGSMKWWPWWASNFHQMPTLMRRHEIKEKLTSFVWSVDYRPNSEKKGLVNATPRPLSSARFCRIIKIDVRIASKNFRLIWRLAIL